MKAIQKKNQNTNQVKDGIYHIKNENDSQYQYNNKGIQ